MSNCVTALFMLNTDVNATKNRGGSPYKPPSTAHLTSKSLAAEHAHIDPRLDHPLPCQTGF